LTITIENIQTGNVVRHSTTHGIEDFLESLDLDHEPFSVAEITFPIGTLESIETTIRDLGFDVDGPD